MADSRRRSAADLYRREWSVGTPNLATFLGNHPPLSPEDQVDLIEIDRAERWRRGQRVSAEHYLRDCPAIQADVELALVVIYGEFFLRKDLGESPQLLEYIARFPQHARRLRDQVMWHEAIELDPPSADGPPNVPGVRIGGPMGRGGMCFVYRAVDEATGEDVAVKLLDPAYRTHPVRVARFAREVASLARLAHPHIVRAIRTGESGGLPFLVMEYCPGGTLAGRRLPPAEAAAVVACLAGAVAYAHGQGVVHRDLKPSNVLLAADGREKIADYGLAKCAAELGGSLTATRDVLGTPCYMAPELATGARDADERTDVYGLGAILYELLTGRPPFVGAEPLEVVWMVREDPPTRPSVINPGVPAELEAVCLRCLEKEPRQRYQTATAMAQAIAEASRPASAGR